MKPDGELTSEMEEDIEPVELFSELGMLVTEGRLPSSSAKGRQEGPHCPYGPGEQRGHVCEALSVLCLRARELHHQMMMLWKNKIPMCIEVLLYPECEHGRQAATSADVSQPGMSGGCVLLEQWTVQISPKRGGDSTCSYRTLYQAVRSYLHFSQLSAWFNLSHGTEPRNLAYRISPPGEFCTSSFPGTPTWHTFPICSVSKTTAIRVTVGSQPRSQQIIKVPCYEHGPIRNIPDIETENGSSVGEAVRSRSPPSRSSTPTNRSSGSSTPTFGKGSTETLSENSSSDNESEPCLSPRNKSLKGGKVKLTAISEDENTAAVLTQETTDKLKQVEPECTCDKTPVNARNIHYGGAKPKRPTSVPYHKKSQYSPQDADALNFDAMYKRKVSYKSLQSPKVLFSKKSPSMGFFGKERVSNTDSSDSDNSSSPDMDRFLKSIAIAKDPLSPSEIESYLARLASRKKKRACSPLARELKQSFEELSLDNKQPMQKPPCTFTEVDETNSHRVDFYIGKHKKDSQEENGVKDTNLHSGEENGICVKTQSSQNGFQVENGVIAPVKYEPKTDDTQNEKQTSPNAKQYNKRPSSMALPSRAYASTDHLSQNGALANEGVTPRPVTRPMVIHSPTDAVSVPGFSGFNRGTALFKCLVRRELNNQAKEAEVKDVDLEFGEFDVPTSAASEEFQKNLRNSANMIFHAKTGLPLQSSPAPVKKSTGGFHFDKTLTNPRAIKNSISCVSLDHQCNDKADDADKKDGRFYSTSAPASTNCLLGNFEESVLNGRIEPSGVIEGFTAEIGASGAFCPKHITLPVTAFFFTLSDDNAPSPYLGHINLDSLGKRGYHVPKRGTVQVTLFNPNHTVVKMFVVMYDLNDMPSNCQTFLRQRTLYMPSRGTPSELQGLPVFMRYLIHLRFASSKTGKIYLHTDIRLIFARDKFEFDSKVANYELRSFTDTPCNPKYSPKR